MDKLQHHMVNQLQLQQQQELINKHFLDNQLQHLVNKQLHMDNLQ